MKRLSMLVALSFACPAQAELITVPFSAVATSVFGAPFGIQAQVGVTPVTGWFTYESTRPSSEGCESGCQVFLAKPSAALSLSIGGNTITSSDFSFRTYNNAFGAFDAFQARVPGEAIPGEIRLNGAQITGSALVILHDRESVMFPTDAATQFLPTRAQLRLVDDIAVRLASFGSELYFEGSIIPEPCALLLAAQLLCVLGCQRSAYLR